VGGKAYACDQLDLAMNAHRMTTSKIAESASYEPTYRAMYAASVTDPEAFWGKKAKRIDWIRPFTKVKNTSFAYPDVFIKWFEDGTLNVCSNCIDRHLEERGNQVAIIWEPDDPNAEAQRITYRELYRLVNIFANVLGSMGVKRGDRVTIYLPMIPEAAFAILACARIGAIHSVVFGGFSPDSLASRITEVISGQ
jgi:acetyl-CoA synthetase